MGLFKKKKATEEPPEEEAKEDVKASEPVEEGETAEQPSKKGGLPQIVILAGVIVVLVAVSYVLQRTFLFQSSSSAHAHSVEKEKSHDKEDEAHDEEAPVGEMVMLNEIIVNPAGTGGRRFLAVTMGFEVVQAEKHEEKEEGGHGAAEGSWIDNYKPLIQDALIGLLSSKNITDLASISYRDTLREEVRARIEQEIKPNEVTRVFFTGYVLQ